MASKGSLLHGSIAAQCRVALLLVDVINPMSYRGSAALVRAAARAAPNIKLLKARARRARIPCVYVNDNFGLWRSDFRATVRNASAKEAPGRAVTRALLPDDYDYFVLKPKRSGFYGTSLDLLLTHLGVRTVVLAGFATNVCIQSTAHDAYLRDLHIVVPEDCVASDDAAEHRGALKWMKGSLGALTPQGRRVSFARLSRRRE